MICPEKKANFLATAAKATGHGVLSALPVIGAGISAYDVTKDLGKGDLTGAGLDTANAALSLSSTINPFIGMPASVALTMYNDSRKRKRDEMEALKAEADRRQQETSMYSYNQKAAASNFERDLSDPRAGVGSDLYHAISPLIGGGASAGNLSPEEMAREQAMQEQVRKGLVGLEYMTGLKKNTGNTYYDEHPAAAVGSDILGNAGAIGAGLAAGGAGSNLLNQYRNFKMTRPSQDARTGNYGVDPAHPRNLLNPKEGPIRADIARVFGDFTTDPESRLRLIDELNASGGHSSDYVSKYHALVAAGEDPKKLFHEANRTPGAAMLEDYANFHETAQRAKAKGGFKKYWGEDLHTAPNAGTAQEGVIKKFMRENLAPAHMQGFTDLAEDSNLTAANPQYHRNLMKSISEEVSPGAGAKAFAETGFKDLENLTHQGSGISKLLKRTRLPLAVGAGVAAGGAGLYSLVKALQNQSHSKQKINDWKKTLLQSRGDFDQAGLYDTPEPRDYHQPSIEEAPQPSEAMSPQDYSPAEEEAATAPEALPHPAKQQAHSNDIDWSEALNSVR
jgi:hypothetical protein